MSELEDIWHNQEQYTPLGVARNARAVDAFKQKNEWLRTRLEEARQLLQEAVDRYPVEKDSNLWTSRVRKWLSR